MIPYRPAVLIAKQVATLQELSGERIILGAGVGWLREEFEALGVIRANVERLLTKRFSSCTRCLRTISIRMMVNSCSFPRLFLRRVRSPPIWIGGGGPKALERTLQFGDAYYPIGLKPDELTQIGAYFREEANKRGRPAPELIVGGMIREGEGGSASMVDRISAYRDAGANFYVLVLVAILMPIPFAVASSGLRRKSYRKYKSGQQSSINQKEACPLLCGRG